MAMTASHAFAHAQLEGAEPAAGSAVHESLPRLKLRFSQRLERPFSEVRVLTPEGKQVDNRDSKVDGADARPLSVSLSRLSPPAPTACNGACCRWTATSATVTSRSMCVRRRVCPGMRREPR